MPSTTHALVMAALTALLLAAATAVWRPLARRTGWAPGATLGLLLGAAVCLGMTLPDQLVAGTADRLGACLTGDSARTLGGGLAHHAVNVLLWTPIGLCGALATRRPVTVAATASATWALVELLQTLDPVRSCQPVDWANNTLGVAAGALAAWRATRNRPRATA